MPMEARKKFLTAMNGAGSGPAIEAEKLILQLPISLMSFEKKTFVSTGLKIFDSISPFDTIAEQEIITALVTELNSKQGAHLATEIDFDRGGTRPAAIVGQKTVIIVGSSHSNYLATAMAAQGYKAVTVDLKNWRPNTSTVAETLTDLEAKIAINNNVVAIIYWCLDNATYYSVTEDSILPAVRDVSGHYHIHGNLIIAPSEMFSKSVKVCIPLFNINSNAKKIVLSPLPRYWQRRCCGDTDHVANLEEEGYEAELFSGLDSTRRIIKDVLNSHGVKDVKVYSTSQLCVSVEGSRSTGSDVRDALAILWGEDPVHPSRDCYTSLGEHIDALLNSICSAGSVSTIGSERPLKRPRWLEDESSSTVVPRNVNRGRGSNYRGRGPRRGSRGGGRGPRGGRGRY
jgi:hypothetical protein